MVTYVVWQCLLSFKWCCSALWTFIFAEDFHIWPRSCRTTSGRRCQSKESILFLHSSWKRTIWICYLLMLFTTSLKLSLCQMFQDISVVKTFVYTYGIYSRARMRLYTITQNPLPQDLYFLWSYAGERFFATYGAVFRKWKSSIVPPKNPSQ